MTNFAFTTLGLYLGYLPLVLGHARSAYLCFPLLRIFRGEAQRAGRAGYFGSVCWEDGF
jgi:hypothetical protein